MNFKTGNENSIDVPVLLVIIYYFTFVDFTFKLLNSKEYLILLIIF